MSNTTIIKGKPTEGSGTISAPAWEIICKGATDNSEGENTVVVNESVWQTAVYRIFRQRHPNGDPLKASDHWIRTVKAHCTSTYGDLKVVAVQAETDGGSVIVGISGPGIIAKDDTGQVI